MVIVYKSSTGFTKEYAEKLAKELNVEVYDYKKVTKDIIKNNELIIYGSRVHAGLIDGLGKYKKLYNNGTIKKLIVFATGATPIEATKEIETIWNNNLDESERKNIKTFYFPSGLRYEKMKFLDRTIMKMVSKMLAKSKDKDDTDEGFATAISKSHDISDDKYIIPLVEYVNTLEK